jgi:uncharacterized protein (DUF58 family)
VSDPPPLTRRSSPRLVAYVVIAVGGLFGSLATGRPELAALAAPAALLAVAGVVLAERPHVTVTLRLAHDRALEGDTVGGDVVVTTDRGVVELAVPVSGRVSVAEPAHGRLAWTVEGRGQHVLPLQVVAGDWGIGHFDRPVVRAFGPLGLVRWEGPVGRPRVLRVLPPVATLRRLLDPDEPRAAAGTHLARQRAEGVEFAEVRPYAPGDRLRAVNWSVSSRRGGLWVNQRHPERSADVVLLVDTFADTPEGSMAALVPAVRAAWMIASAHLRAFDRVGVVTFGGYPSWLAPRGGDRARYALLDRLLDTRAGWTEAPRSVRFIPSGILPAGAAVVALSPLHDLRLLDALVDLRRRGLPVVVVDIDVLGDLKSDVDSTARRLWTMECERRRDLLVGAGCGLVAWRPDEGPAAVIDAVARVRRPRPARVGLTTTGRPS